MYNDTKEYFVAPVRLNVQVLQTNPTYNKNALLCFMSNDELVLDTDTSEHSKKNGCHRQRLFRCSEPSQYHDCPPINLSSTKYQESWQHAPSIRIFTTFTVFFTVEWGTTRRTCLTKSLEEVIAYTPEKPAALIVILVSALSQRLQNGSSSGDASENWSHSMCIWK